MTSDDDVRRLLSPARLAPYCEVAGRLGCDPLALYAWNVRVSSAFFEDLHYFEVALRNAIDGALTEQFGSENEWFDTPGLLSLRSRRAVAEARRRARGDSGRVPSHGKTVAELPFGFWWSLLADEYNRSLWQPALRHAFTGPMRRRTLHGRVDDLRRLRNRIAHHEPIHGRDLRTDHTVLLDTAGRIHPSLAGHVTTWSRVPLLLTQQPGRMS